MKIKLFVTGGIINKEYDTKNKNLYFSSKPIFNIINQVNYTSYLSIETLFMKEPCDINKQDIKLIIKSCKSSNFNKILINFTIKEKEKTILLLDKLNSIENHQTIILFDSTIPYQFENSDASFILGVVVGAISYLEKGVYIFKNGKIVNSLDMKKSSFI